MSDSASSSGGPPAFPLWANGPHADKRIPPRPPEVRAIADAGLRARAKDVWDAAQRLRVVLDCWGAWWQELRIKGDADPGWALRYREEACQCIRALTRHRPRGIFSEAPAEELIAQLPQLPSPDVGWNEDVTFRASYFGAPMLWRHRMEGRLYTLVGELSRYPLSVLQPLPADSSDKIPPERRTIPLSMYEAAKFMGYKGKRNAIVKKLRAIMNDGSIPFEKLTRQQYIFDRSDFPSEAHHRITPNTGG